MMLAKNNELHVDYQNPASGFPAEGEARQGRLISDMKCGCNSVVECKLPKLDVAGSNPVAR